MQTLTIQIKDHDGLKALQDLEGKHLIHIVEKTNLTRPLYPDKQ